MTFPCLRPTNNAYTGCKLPEDAKCHPCIIGNARRQGRTYLDLLANIDRAESTATEFKPPAPPRRLCALPECGRRLNANQGAYCSRKCSAAAARGIRWANA